jgi:DNA-binding PadR family transcriptional regulator
MLGVRYVPTESLLSYVLLGLLHEEPRSGYDLRKIVVSTPMALFSDSPGAIYPALRRLAREGLIAPERVARGGRRRSLFAPSAKGRDAFAAWLRRPPTRDEVVRGWDVLMLRLAFMSGIVRPAEIAAFLDRVHLELEGHLAELEAFATSHGQKMPPSAKLAFESGLAGYRAQVKWARQARQRMRNRRTS